MRGIRFRTRQFLALALAASFTVVLLLVIPPVSRATTPQEWMAKVLQRYEHKYGNTSIRRRVSYSPDDWPSNSGDLIRLTQLDAPLFSEPSFVQQNLRVTGIGKKGEVFQLLERQQLVFISNPLSDDWKAPNSSGIWARIRAIDGTEGWIFAGTAADPMSYLSWARTSKNTKSASTFDLILSGLFNVGVAAVIIVLLYRHFTRSRQRAQTSPASPTSSTSSSNSYNYSSGSSASYDYSSYSGRGHRVTTNEDDVDEELDEQETGSPTRSSSFIDIVSDVYEDLLPKTKRRKCPDCDGDATFDPQETGDGVCSECHGSGWNPDLLENDKCPACGGKKNCQTCRGKGYVKD